MRWDFFVRHYAVGRDAAEGPEIPPGLSRRPGRRRSLSAGRHFGRLHRPQCDDPGLSAQCGLGRDRPADRRPIMERRRRCGGYFERLENCHHRPLERAAGGGGPEPVAPRLAWLAAGREVAIPPAAVRRFRAGAGLAPFGRARRSTISGSRSNVLLDLVEVQGRSERLAAGDRERSRRALHAVGDARSRADGRARAGIGDGAEIPGPATVELDALVTRVLLDENNRATGVEYLKGERLYRAHGQPATGRWRTPSGTGCARGHPLRRRVQHAANPDAVGDRTAREYWSRSASRCRVELPGVGKNLQDRYEVGVVNRMSFDRWNVLEGVTFSRGDPAIPRMGRKARGALHQQWRGAGGNPQITARAAAARICSALRWSAFSAGIFPATPRSRSPSPII